MAFFYDTHAHLDYPDYAKDLTEVIARAQAAGDVYKRQTWTRVTGDWKVAEPAGWKACATLRGHSCPRVPGTFQSPV